MFEADKEVGMSCVLFSPRRCRPLGFFAVLPPSVLNQLKDRDTHINLAEVAAALLAPVHAPELLARAFCLHFVDNTAALSGFIKGRSPQQDTAALLAVFGTLFARINSKFWHEWVE